MEAGKDRGRSRARGQADGQVSKRPWSPPRARALARVRGTAAGSGTFHRDTGARQTLIQHFGS